jgi:hypothetical protein
MDVRDQSQQSSMKRESPKAMSSPRTAKTRSRKENFVAPHTDF